VYFLGRRILWALPLGLALFLVSASCSSSDPDDDASGGKVRAPGFIELTPVGEVPAPKVGRPAPDFTLPDVDGKPVSLHDYDGKYILVNFWGTWCPPCRAEMPDMQIVYEELKSQGLEIIGVDAPPDTEEDVRTFVTRGGFTWVFVMDKTWEVARTYRIGAFPSTFFLDKDHVVRQVRVGAMNEKELRVRLSKLME